jgi:biopolymer transport protein ExbB/TolQ
MIKRRTRFWQDALSNITMPTVIGLSLFVGLYAAINRGWIGNEEFVRYMAGHPICKISTAMFLIGLAALGMIAWRVITEMTLLDKISLDKAGDADAADATPAERSKPAASPMPVAPAQAAQHVIDRLTDMPSRVRDQHAWRRMYAAASFVAESSSCEGLAEQLKSLAATDRQRRHEPYALVRLLIWATPMLGFLGTVLGISAALGSLAIGADLDFAALLAGLRKHLYVAFDTTALALSYAVGLMFVQFFVDRLDGQLLTAVDARVVEQLGLHLDVASKSGDEHSAALDRLVQKFAATGTGLVEQQAQLWRQSMDAAQAAWSEGVRAADDQVCGHLEAAFEGSLRRLTELTDSLAERLTASSADAIVAWQTGLADCAHLVAQTHEHIARQCQSLDATADQLAALVRVHGTLEEYVRGLPDTRHFAEATAGLATAIRLLEFRLSELQHAESTDDVSTEPHVLRIDSSARRAA